MRKEFHIPRTLTGIARVILRHAKGRDKMQSALQIFAYADNIVLVGRNIDVLKEAMINIKKDGEENRFYIANKAQIHGSKKRTSTKIF
jgi:RNase P/RNase MRP subunit p30